MKPGDYPLGSSRSRAAARHALTARKSVEGEWRPDSIGSRWGISERGTEVFLSNPALWHVCNLQVLALKPGDFPLFSHRSRAAARSLLAEKHSLYERREVIISNPLRIRARYAMVFRR